MEWDIKSIVSGGIAVFMAITAGVQEFRVQDLDTDLSSVAGARDKAASELKAIKDGVISNAGKADRVITELQDQLTKSQAQVDLLQGQMGSVQGRLEAAQANTQRVADLAEKLCARTPRQH